MTTRRSIPLGVLVRIALSSFSFVRSRRRLKQMMIVRIELEQGDNMTSVARLRWTNERRSVCAILLIILSGWRVAAAEPDLFAQFQDPPRKHSLTPFWAWVEEIEPERVREQIRMMAEQRVYGAYVFGFWGLRTPYMSPEWMAGMRAALEEGKRQQVHVGFITDYLWPQGEYRDPWNLDPPAQSRVTFERPQYARKQLACVEKTVAGPAAVAFEGLQEPDGGRGRQAGR